MIIVDMPARSNVESPGAVADYPTTGFERVAAGPMPEARCKDNPDAGWSSSPAIRATVVRLCASCPLLADCRRLGEGQTSGVWGGVDRTSNRTAITNSAPVPGKRRAA